MSQIFTIEEVADHFKINRRIVRQKVNEGWPCIRINKVQIRFTEEHLRAIEQMTFTNETSLEAKFGRITK